MEHPENNSSTRKYLTIPNALSAFRILLLPFIVKSYLDKSFTTAVILLLISAISDILDGPIARKLHQVSDFGKLLDPVADKLTEASMLVCIALIRPIAFVTVAVMCVKESIVYTVHKKVYDRTGNVYSANWHGKLATVVLYITICVHLVFPQIPETVTTVMCLICTALILLSLVLYLLKFTRILKASRH